MGFFNKIRTDGATYDGQGEKRRGVIDIIQYNGGSDDLVWKFPYNNLSIGAQLVVNKSQEAIFVKGGAVCDVFGEGTHTLSSNGNDQRMRYGEDRIEMEVNGKETDSDEIKNLIACHTIR